MAISELQNASENRYSSRGRYKQSFINLVVREVEEGLDIREACERHHVRRNRLQDWLDKYSAPSYTRPKLLCYSAVQKKSICRSIAQGKLTVQEAVSTYGVHSTTIYSWQRKEKCELEFPKDGPLKKPTKLSLIKSSKEVGDDEMK